MRPIAIDVARSVVCLAVSWGTGVSCEKTAEPIEMPFGRLTHVGPKNHVLDGAADPRTGRGTFEGDMHWPTEYLRMANVRALARGG